MQLSTRVYIVGGKQPLGGGEGLQYEKTKANKQQKKRNEVKSETFK